MQIFALYFIHDSAEKKKIVLIYHFQDCVRILILKSHVT